MRSILCVLLLAVPLLNSGATGESCLQQGPLLVCPTLIASSDGSDGTTGFADALCLDDLCAEGASAAACDASIADATAGSVAETGICVLDANACIRDAGCAATATKCAASTAPVSSSADVGTPTCANVVSCDGACVPACVIGSDGCPPPPTTVPPPPCPDGSVFEGWITWIDPSGTPHTGPQCVFY